MLSRRQIASGKQCSALKAGVSWSVTMGLKILMLWLFRTLDKATYPIHLGTVGQSNQTINFLMFAPCVLEMVME